MINFVSQGNRQGKGHIFLTSKFTNPVNSSIYIFSTPIKCVLLSETFRFLNYGFL